jgi:hypothetical protein
MAGTLEGRETMTAPGRLGCCAGAVVLLLLGGCTALTEQPATPRPNTPTAIPAVTPTPSDSGSPSAAPSTRNDLAKMPLRRSLKAGSVTVQVEYSSSVPVTAWRTSVPKPLRVTMTAVNTGKRGQKIYLTKLTGDVTVYDEAGPIDSPRDMVDAASLSPGYIVTAPNTYNQTFSLGSIDSAATSVTIDFAYEIVLEIDRTARDYAKQSVTDSITVPVVA